MPKEVNKLIEQMANRSQAGGAGIFSKPTGKGSIDLIKEIIKMAKEERNGTKGKA